MLVGLVVGLSGALAAMHDGMRIEAAERLTSDVIVVSADDVGEQVAATDGVALLSTSTQTVVHVMASDDPDMEELRDTAVTGGTIDPATFFSMYDLEAGRGSLDTLADGAIALAPELAGRMDVDVGEATTVTVGGVARRVTVGAVFPFELGSLSEILISGEVFDGASPDACGMRETAVLVDDPAATDAVVADLNAAGIDARATDEAIAVMLDAADRQNRSIQIALLGLSALFTLVAIVNAVVVAGTDRGGEFATLRLTGLTRGQVLRASLAESTIVVATGSLLGLIAAAGTGATMSPVPRCQRW